MAQRSSQMLGGLTRIRSMYPSLTPTEKRVADYCLENPDQIIYLSVTQLGERCAVGESTIIRFSQAAGFSGYQDLKLNIALELSSRGNNAAEGILGVDDSVETLIEKVTAINVSALEDTAKLVDPHALELAIEKLITAKRIFLYGVGVSGITALDAQSKFLRVGLMSYALSDSHLQIMSSAQVGSGDLCIGISHSGSTRDTVDTLRLAKQNGAFTMAITDIVKSPIIEYSDLVLLTGSTEDPLQGGSLRSKIAQVHMVDLLYTGVALKLGEEAAEQKKKVALSVVDRLY